MPVHKTNARTPVNLVAADLIGLSRTPGRRSARVSIFSCPSVNSVGIVRSLVTQRTIRVTDIGDGPLRLFWNGQIKVNDHASPFFAVQQNYHRTNYDRLNLSGRGEFR